ncbi:MAG: methyl-accepting chemotaxis protein [Myxococcales bacterium]
MPVSLEQARAERQYDLVRFITRISVFGIVPMLVARDAVVMVVQPSRPPVQSALYVVNLVVMAAAMLAGDRVLRRDRLEQSFAFVSFGILFYVLGVSTLREDAQIVCSFGVVGMTAMAYLVSQAAFRRTVVGSIVIIDLGIVVGWASPWPRLVVPVWLEGLEGLGLATAILLLLRYALQRKAEESEADIRRVREAGERQAKWTSASEKSVKLLSQEMDLLQRTIETLRQQAAEQEAMVARTTSALQELSATAGANAEGAKRLLDVAESSRGEVVHATESFASITRDAEKAVGLVEESRQLVQNVAAVAKEVDSVLTFLQRIVASLRMLSINARLEASRAGEAGRGFAVVVGELMTLLEETRGNFVRSKKLLGGIKADAARSAELSDQGAKAVGAEARTVKEASGVLEAMTRSLGVMSAVASPIGTGAQDQQQGVADLVLAIDQQRSLSDAIRASVDQLADLSTRLRQMRDEIEAAAKSVA